MAGIGSDAPSPAQEPTGSAQPLTVERCHFGDPCIYCRTPHDEVTVGPCPAAARAVEIVNRLYRPTTTREQALEIVGALVGGLYASRKLFSEINGDWSDPSSQCREGWDVFDAAFAKALGL